MWYACVWHSPMVVWHCFCVCGKMVWILILSEKIFSAESHKGLMISHCLTLALFPCARCQSGLSDSILTVGGHSILPLHWSWCVSLWAVPHTTFLSFFCFLLQWYSVWDHMSYVICLYWIFCIFLGIFQIFEISQTRVWKSILQISHVWLGLTSWFFDDQDYMIFSPYFKHFCGIFVWRNFMFRVKFLKQEMVT